MQRPAKLTDFEADKSLGKGEHWWRRGLRKGHKSQVSEKRSILCNESCGEKDHREQPHDRPAKERGQHHVEAESSENHPAAHYLWRSEKYLLRIGISRRSKLCRLLGPPLLKTTSSGKVRREDWSTGNSGLVVRLRRLQSSWLSPQTESPNYPSRY